MTEPTSALNSVSWGSQRANSVFAVAVFVLVGTHVVADRYGPWNPPYSL